MFRTCINVLNIVSNNLNHGGKYALIKRHAGHSKWANIKHTKTATDLAKSQVTSRLIYKLQWAVRNGGPNPELNRNLKSIITEAKKNNIQKETLEKAIARATGEGGKTVIFNVRGPKNLIFSVECFTHAPPHIRGIISSISKKYNFTVEQVTGHEEEMTRIGIVKCKPLTAGEDALDKALEHAIEIGAEEVTEDEEKNIVFQTHINRVHEIREKLEALGYSIDFADVVVQFKLQATLNDAEIELCEKFVNKLDDIQDIVKVSDNIA